MAPSSSPPGGRYRLRPDVRYRVLAGEAVVLRQDTAEVLALNAMGSQVLRLLDVGRTREEIVEALVAESGDGVPQEQIEQDVGEFLDELKGAGVIEEA